MLYHPVKILFVIERYVIASYPHVGLTNSEHNIIGSWECAGLGSSHCCYISNDDGDLHTTACVDEALLSHDYDFAFLTPHNGVACSLSVAKHLQSRLILAYWDSLLMPQWREFAAQGNLCLLFDQGCGAVSPNAWAMAVPQDTRIFRPNKIEQDIDVSFAGALAPWKPDRRTMMNLLSDAGLTVYAPGGRVPGGNLSVADYVNIYHRSKINLCPQQQGRKGRIFEIMACGGFALASNHHSLDGWFENGQHYVGWDDNDLVAKVKHYLDDQQTRVAIASSGHEHYRTHYDPKSFWTRVLSLASV